MSHDAFISYSTKDKVIADAICAKLEERKIRCWIAPRDVPPGQDFATSIIDAIDRCGAFVLIWSAETNKSQHILNEVNRAFNQGITVIPFRIEDVAPTKALEYYIGRTHWLDAITPPLEKHIERLAETILPFLRVTREQAAAGLPTEERESVEAIPKQEPAPPQPEARRTRALPRRLWIGLSIGGTIGLAAFLVFRLLRTLPASEPPASTAAPAPIFTETQAFIPTAQSTFTAMPTETAGTPEGTPPPAPWIADFGDPILLAIQDRIPDFQDKFIQESSEWKLYSPLGQTASLEIANGVLAFSGNGHSVHQAANSSLNFENFVLQVDMYTQKLTPGCRAAIQWRGGGDGPGRVFDLNRDGMWGLYSIYGTQNDLQFSADTPSSGSIPPDSSAPYTITIISNDPGIAVYLNGNPVTYVDDIPRPAGPGFEFSLWVPDDEVCVAEYDNLKVWDLDRVE